MLQSKNTTRIRAALRSRGISDRVLSILLSALLSLPIAAWSAQSLLAETAPDFALKNLAGKNLRLSEYRGEVVLVSFWSVRCGKCREQLSTVDDLYSQHEGEGFQVLSVSIDKKVDKARQMAAGLGLRFPVLSDDDRVASRLYDINELPMTVLIDPHGTVRHVHKGYAPGDADTYRTELEELLAE